MLDCLLEHDLAGLDCSLNVAIRDKIQDRFHRISGKEWKWCRTVIIGKTRNALKVDATWQRARSNRPPKMLSEPLEGLLVMRWGDAAFGIVLEATSSTRTAKKGRRELGEGHVEWDDPSSGLDR